jgi:hypothetical protein
MFAISVPIFVLMAVFGFYNQHVGANVTPGEPCVSCRSDVDRPQAARRKSPEGSGMGRAVRAAHDQGGRAAAAAKPEAERRAYLAEHQKPYSLLYTYSLIIALVCGTAGCRTSSCGSTRIPTASPRSAPRCGS